MLSAYPACFIKEDSGYSIIFPDLDIATCGDTLDDAFSMAVTVWQVFYILLTLMVNIFLLHPHLTISILTKSCRNLT